MMRPCLHTRRKKTKKTNTNGSEQVYAVHFPTKHGIMIVYYFPSSARFLTFTFIRFYGIHLHEVALK